MLEKSGFKADHVRSFSMGNVPDPLIFDKAMKEGRVIVTADSDFSEILFKRQLTEPSIIQFKGAITRNPDLQIEILVTNLNVLSEELKRGAVVTLTEDRIRIRPLVI